MIIGDRLRAIREHKNMSQGDMEKRTGLLRCHISRLENGHTVPAIETLEKRAQAFEMPLYQVLYDGDGPPQPLTHVGGNCGSHQECTKSHAAFSMVTGPGESRRRRVPKVQGSLI
jgi:transcriptional regulator with XRE-family HTH domain